METAYIILHTKNMVWYILLFHQLSRENPPPRQFDKYKENVINRNIKFGNSKPNVIVILSESFCDLHTHNYLDFNKEYMGNVTKIMKNSISGNMYVSVFGNNTATTAFEVLTGIPSLFSTQGSLVYHNYFNSDIPNIVDVFNKNDYVAYAFEPWYSKGYNQDIVWKTIYNFSEIKFMDDFNDLKYIRNFPKDEVCIDEIINFEYKYNKPVFIYCQTMQNHGGYAWFEDITPIQKEEFINSSNDELNIYASLCHETDKQIQRLIDYYKDYNEETVIVFFGDHQPMIEDLFDGSVEQKFKVPVFIWTNFEIDFNISLDNLSINYLPSILLKVLNIEDGWFDFVYDLKDEYPVLSNAIQMDKNGQIIEDFNKILEEEETKDFSNLKLYQVLSYKYVFIE